MSKKTELTEEQLNNLGLLFSLMYSQITKKSSKLENNIKKIVSNLPPEIRKSFGFYLARQKDFKTDKVYKYLINEDGEFNLISASNKSVALSVDATPIAITEFKFILEIAQEKEKFLNLVSLLVNRKEYGELSDGFKLILIKMAILRELVCDGFIRCVNTSYFSDNHKSVLIRNLLTNGREQDALKFVEPEPSFGIQIVFAEDAPLDLLPMFLDFSSSTALKIIEQRMMSQQERGEKK